MKQRLEDWDNLHKGDLVKIAGERGLFVVQWIDEFDSERPPEVTLFGGSNGKGAWRTVFSSKIKTTPKKRIKRKGTE